MEEEPLGSGPVFYVAPLRIVAPPGVPAVLPQAFDPINLFNNGFGRPATLSFDTIYRNFRLDDDGIDHAHAPANGSKRAHASPDRPHQEAHHHHHHHHQHQHHQHQHQHHRRRHHHSGNNKLHHDSAHQQQQSQQPGSPSSSCDTLEDDDDVYASLDELKEKKSNSNEPCTVKPIFGGASSASPQPPRHALINALRAYEAVRRCMVSEEENKDPDAIRSTRPDLSAGSVVNINGLAINRSSKVIGPVPGVHIGDLFFFRMEMCCIGMHGPIQAGIEYLTMKESEYGMPVATSVISSGGYNAKDDGEVLIYTGQGGRSGHENRASEDQKLQRGNLAMEGSLKHSIPVRVTRGIKDPCSPSGKTYIYDGLYKVEQCWSEKGTSGFEEYKFKLRRLPGQRELGSAVLKLSNTLKYKPRERKGLCVADISSGKEDMPICVVNLLDNLRSPPPFEYTTRLYYPHGAAYYQQLFGDPLGCDCEGACNVSQECSCAAMNGNVFPYLNGGVLVRERALVYECGNNCRCPSSCRNRLTQRGTKFRLEVFKTEDRGWGLRSWDTIPAGSFICEYTGKLIDNTELPQSRDYLLDTSRLSLNTPLWGDVSKLLNSQVARVKDFAPRPDIIIDSGQTGNASRFINHSCSPNVFAQCVLWDHDGAKHPHIMLFAMDNITPFDELTLDYGTQNPSLNSRWVAKHCLCKSEECKGVFYT